MTDVKDVNPFVIFNHDINYPIDARFVAIEQLPEAPALGRDGASVGVILQADYLSLESLKPAACSGRLSGMDALVNLL